MGDALQVEGLGKRYELGATVSHGTLRDAIVGLFGRERAARDAIWSLRDVSFTLEEGHSLGIIGRNGAGKSTLLKILSRITEPTEGVARMRGRVASLLEVGTGFHPELSGRENVFLNGAILGMSRREVARRYDDIVEFSGVGRFVDTPVKRYSSGMYLRLAFAVAAHLEPDVLVVDEILAVGDAEFQKRCLGKMGEVEAAGRTVVFVSHDLTAIGQLCSRSIWLDGGRVVADGPSREVIDHYLAMALPVDSAPRTSFEGGRVLVHGVSTTNAAGQPASALQRDQPFTIDVDLSVLADGAPIDVALYVMTGRGIRVLDEAWSDTSEDRPSAAGRYRVRMAVPAVLNTGSYTVGVWCGTSFEQYLDEPAAAAFSLEGSAMDRPDRLVVLELPWQATPVGDAVDV
jgi:ABC-2 type transport system ATP-binding protein/lipopolysaccharide transport system ATP-binding protein